MTVAAIESTKDEKRCHVCKTRLKLYEGELCSCKLLLCMKHRYKVTHSCQDGKVATPVLGVRAIKVQKI
ncbi:unnamed protein product [Ectocarpus sp. 12 AP-2014]